jgi:hypothetical protein
MELKLNISLNQIVGLIRELPYSDKLVIKKQLDKELVSKSKDSSISLRELLLSGPIMSKDGYDDYKALKKQFNKRTKKLSA